MSAQVAFNSQHPAPRVPIRARVAALKAKLIPMWPRRRLAPEDQASALWREYLAYVETSRGFAERHNAATTEDARKAVDAEWNAFDDGNELPRYFAIVDAIRDLPPGLNACAVRLLVDVVSGHSGDIPLNGRSIAPLVFSLRSLLPFLSDPIAGTAREFIACADADMVLGDTPVWH